MKSKLAPSPYSLPIFALILLLGATIVTMLLASVDVFSKEGLGVYLMNVWDASRGVYGGLAAIYGSLIVSGLAVLVAMPLSLATSIFVNEFAPKGLREVLVNLSDLMASFPTIIYGLWGLYFLAPLLKEYVMDPLHESLGFIPLFSTKPVGTCFFTAGILLAIMITPFATSIIREAYGMIPREVKEGVYALGLGKWEVVKVSIGYIKGAIAGGFALAFGRGIGETVAVALTVGGVLNLSPSLFSPGYTIPALIVDVFPASYFPGTQASALMALALLLFVIGVSVTLIGKLIIRGYHEG